jgi:hypothetical protein
MIPDTQFVTCKTRYEAKKACPWAVTTWAVEGGYMCFASRLAWRKWRRWRKV